MILLFTSTVLAVIVGAPYAIVLANVGNAFPMSGNHSYLDSPYWLGLKRSNTTVLTGLQVLATIGYIVWLVDLLSTLSERVSMAGKKTELLVWGSNPFPV
jgi:hypothetical protein